MSTASWQKTTLEKGQYFPTPGVTLTHASRAFGVRLVPPNGIFKVLGLPEIL